MRCLFLVLLLVPSGFADLKYRIQTTARQVGDTDRIVYVQGQRIRTDALKSRRVSIRECDLNRIVVLDPTKKTYRILPILPKPDVPSSQSSPESGEQVCRGTPRRQVEEVGDGTMLGVPVQHMKIWIYSDPIPDSCTVPNRHSSPPQRSQFRIRFPLNRHLRRFVWAGFSHVWP